MQGDPKNTKKDLMLKNQFYTQIYLANCGDYGLVLVICQNLKIPHRTRYYDFMGEMGFITPKEHGFISNLE